MNAHSVMLVIVVLILGGAWFFGRMIFDVDGSTPAERAARDAKHLSAEQQVQLQQQNSKLHVDAAIRPARVVGGPRR